MNSPTPLTLALTLAILTVPSAGQAAAEQREEAVAKALQQVQRSSPAEWRTRLDPETGTPHTIYGSRSAPLNLRTQDAASAVRGFLLGHAELFRVRPGVDDYLLGRKIEMNGMQSIRMQQVYRGVPV